MRILGIDPGSERSAWVMFDTSNVGFVIDKGEAVNSVLLDTIYLLDIPVTIGIEQIRGYGIPAGNETFDTCEWAGRMYEGAKVKHCKPVMVPRADVLKAFDIGRKDSDKWLREKMVDEYPLLFPNAKRNKAGSLIVPGWNNHTIAALAVAITVAGKEA